MADPLPAPGLADPVVDSQAVFRAVLDVLSRPGTRRRVAVELDPPAPLSAAAGAVLLTLADLDTPLWLDPKTDAPAVRHWLAFHCGCPRTENPGQAALAVLAGPPDGPSLEGFSIGTPTHPERSTTLILEVADLSDGSPLVLEGPGIAETARLAPRGLPRGFVAAWAANRALFPQGVDLILTAGRDLAGLPRTTTVKEA